MGWVTELEIDDLLRQTGGEGVGGIEGIER